MRKLLLASVAALGVSVGYGAANAQQIDDSGQSTTSAFGGNVSGPSQAPGTLVVRFNGRVYAQGGFFSQGDANGSFFYNPVTAQVSELPFLSGPSLSAPVTVGGVPMALPQFYGTAAQATALGYRPTTTAAGPQNVAVIANQPGRNKNGNYGVYSYARLYPGFDGIAANGLKYGASIEIRQDGNWPAGNGGEGGISANSSRQGLIYIRRAWGYAGTDRLGMVRVGSTDGPSDLFMVGNNENFGDAGLNGNAFAYIPGTLWYYWPYADGGSNYVPSKIVYLSPAFAGFDFGASFAPSSSGDLGAAATQGCNAPTAGIVGGNAGLITTGPGIAGAGCATLASTNTADYTRPRNIYDVGARYRGLFGPVGFAAYIDYIGSGTVADTLATGHAQVQGYSIGSGGAQVTYGGLTIGAMARGGQVNNTGSWSTLAKQAAPEVDWEAGGSYTYGPFVVGAHYSTSTLAGSSGPAFTNIGGVATSTGIPVSVGQRREQGVAIGGTYSVAPGLALNLTYVWAQKKNNGLDLLTGETSYAANSLNNFGCSPSGIAGRTAACLHNSVKTQLFVLGAQFTW